MMLPRALIRYLAAFPLTILDVLVAPTPPAAGPPDPAAGADLDREIFGHICESCRVHGVPEAGGICCECELIPPQTDTQPHALSLTVDALIERIENLEARIQAIGERIDEQHWENGR